MSKDDKINVSKCDSKKTINSPFMSATEQVSALANKRISSQQLVQDCITRIEALDDKINAVVVRDFDRARWAAKQADEKISQGERAPLLGLPITVKESFSVAGLTKSWGNISYQSFISDTDALAVARLKAAGAIVIGKTNVAYMLKDWQTYNDVYGTTNNPRDINLTPGGSSGGSAAALSAGFVSLELGSDMAGSMRAPAHFCGVFAHKPSLNLIPMRGAEPPGAPASPERINDFAVAGPMARTAKDLSLAFNVLAGPDDWLDGRGYQLSLPNARHQNLRDFRVLVIDAHPLCPISDVMKNTIDRLVNGLVKLGVTVSRDAGDVPNLSDIAHIYATLFTSFAAEKMSAEAYRQREIIAKSMQGDDSFLASQMRGFVLTHRDWLIATRARQQLRKQWRNLYTQYDVILHPVMPTPAFPHDHSDIVNRQIKIDGVYVPYVNQHVWGSVAILFGLPSTVVPIGYTEAGLPMGVQIIGDYLEDKTTLVFADLIEQAFGGFVAPDAMC